MIKHHGGHGHGHRPPYPPPPYHPPPPPRKSGGRTNLASCVLATLFLVFVVIIAFIVYFSLFKAKDPRIVVNAVQIPSFTVANGTVSFTFSEYVSVKNPNRAVFSHYDSTLQLLYGGNQVGFMYIPAGKVAAGQTEYMAATFAVKSIPISPAVGGAVPVPDTVGQVPKIGDGIDRVSPAMEIESRMEVAGRVRILHFFSHHVAVTADCRIAVAINDGSVLGFHC